MLVELEGHYLDGYGDGTDPVTEFRPIRVRATTETPELQPEAGERLDRAMALCGGFATPFGMELLASTHWVATHEGVTGLDECRTALWGWNPRKRELFTAYQVESAWNALRDQGWLDGAELAAAGHQPSVPDTNQMAQHQRNTAGRAR